jgi:signal transduction histidine kinase
MSIGNQPTETSAAPPEGADLVPRLLRLLREQRASTGVRVNLRISSRWPSRLAAGAADDLGRLAEAVLADARQRGGGSRVDVELRSDWDSLVMVVDEDARGAGPLIGTGELAELAVRLGGHVGTFSSDPGGTVVQAIVPRAVWAPQRRRPLT